MTDLPRPTSGASVVAAPTVVDETIPAETLRAPASAGPAFDTWPHAIRAMRHYDFRVLWAGALVSNIGSFMQTVAKSWLVYDISGSAVLVGIDAFATGLGVAFLPVAGVLADRVNRRALLVMTNLVQTIIAAALCVLYARGMLQVWQIIVSSAVMGVVQTLSIPAYHSLMPDLVGNADVGNAVALNSLQFNTSRVLGPAIGGIVLQSVGAAWSFGLNAVSFLAVIAAFIVMRTPLPVRVVRESALRSMGKGLRYLMIRADLITMMTLSAVASAMTAPMLCLLPVLSEEGYGRGAKGYAILLACFGVGAVVGAGMLAIRSRHGPRPWRAFPLLLAMGTAELLIGVIAFVEKYAAHAEWHMNAPLFGLTIVLLAVGGMAFVGCNAGLNTAIIASTPDHIRGRVSSFFVMSFAAGIPLGALVAGLIAQPLGVRWAFGLYGVVTLLLVPAIALIVRLKGIHYRGVVGQRNRRRIAV